MTPDETAFEMIQDLITGTLGMPSVSNRVAKAVAIIQVDRTIDLMFKLNHISEFGYYQQVKHSLINMNL